MQKKRRIPLKKLLELEALSLLPRERSLIVSIKKAQRDYPQITPKMYAAFNGIYDSYFYTGEDQ